ncbi:SRPBCC family protein [Mesorhizobium sp. 1M-11]|uniref:SRPBCC family protein n=1 Tax=Mesorhizobium sp. 1M-11 TaxID=1529006 RepID=UPI0006C75558|nr:SRPBCC family protein [Mesorhizobium sp. 1M-11]
MELHKAPVAEVGMLIRKPAAEVYEAFIDPAVTSKFWFTHGSARLDAGRQVEWEWRMYDFKSPVEVRELVKGRKIVVGWGEPATTVEWTFTPMLDDTATFVAIRNFGFQGDADQQVKTAVDSTDGFALVLSGAKAWLEQGIVLGLIGDRHPTGVPSA